MGRTHRALLGGLLLAGATPAAAGPAAFTIDQVMQAPYPSSLTAAPTGAMAAWVYDARGVRNIWVGDAAGGIKARPITQFTRDDGYDIGDLAWSPDSHAIAFVRGQTLEDDGPANIASTPDGPTPQEVWVMPAAGGTPRKLGTGHSPSFAPDGHSLVFITGQRIMTSDLAGDAPARALITDIGAIRSASWSPDGHRVLFVSQRKAHAIVGVYDVTAKTVTWMAPSFDGDTAPVFSPDGTHIAFARQPTEKRIPFTSRRQGLPWSIWVADAATGAGRQVWQADAGPGSVFHSSLTADSLLWAAGDRLVFPWEKTGWLLPYAVDLRGGAARPLASGGFEVAYMTLSPDRKHVVYAGNGGDIDRLHIWTADPARGSAVPVARDAGIEAFPQLAADGTVFALRSDATHQLAPVVLQGGRWRPMAPDATPASFPAAQLVTPQSVTFRAEDGQTAYGQLFLPHGGGSGRKPAVLFFHGGPPRQMLTGFHYMSAYSWMYAFNQYLASKGYVVLSVNYRGGIGYGLNYREAEKFGAGGGSELNDLLGALSFLEARPDVDTKHVGIWGGSYGGLMTALGLARASDRLAVGVDYAGVYDWSGMLPFYGDPGESEAVRQVAVASSPIATIDRWHAPVLVVHADDDRNVPLAQTTQLIADLRAHGVPHEEMLMPNEVHDLTRYASWMQLFTAADGYLTRYLEPGAFRPNRPTN